MAQLGEARLTTRASRAKPFGIQCCFSSQSFRKQDRSVNVLDGIVPAPDGVTGPFARKLALYAECYRFLFSARKQVCLLENVVD